MARLTPDYVIASLVQRGVPQHVAQGVVMNFQDESGLNTGIQEKAPLAGRGGFGLAQWTGPRRVALEEYARSRGTTVDDPEAQLDFFMLENQGPEAPAWKAVMSAPTAQDAAVAFVNKWERPASKHAAERTARYTGQGPGEGVTKFGGSGLGTPLNTADSPGEGGGKFGGAGLGPEPVSPYKLEPGKTKPTDKYAKAMSAGLGGMAKMPAPKMGAGGNAPQLPAMAPMALDAVPMVASDINARRDQLAMLMQRLNAGQLW